MLLGIVLKKQKKKVTLFVFAVEDPEKSTQMDGI